MRGDAPHRRVEPLEAALVDSRGDLASESAGTCVLVDDQRAIGLLHRGDDRVVVERAERPQVDDLDRQPVFLLQLLGRVQRFPDARRVGDDRQILALARRAGLADRDDVITRRHRLLDATVEILVLEEEHAVVIANRRLEESLGVARGGRIDHLEARRVDESRLRVLRVEGSAADITAARSAADHRTR